MNTQEFVGSLTKKQCRYLLRYAGFSCGRGESRGELRFAIERNLQAGTIGRGVAVKLFGREKKDGVLLGALKAYVAQYGGEVGKAAIVEAERQKRT